MKIALLVCLIGISVLIVGAAEKKGKDRQIVEEDKPKGKVQEQENVADAAPKKRFRRRFFQPCKYSKIVRLCNVCRFGVIRRRCFNYQQCTIHIYTKWVISARRCRRILGGRFPRRIPRRLRRVCLLRRRLGRPLGSLCLRRLRYLRCLYRCNRKHRMRVRWCRRHFFCCNKYLRTKYCHPVGKRRCFVKRVVLCKRSTCSKPKVICA